MAKITKIEAKKSGLPKRLRVAAYARVSLETNRLLHSLSEQVSFYSSLIQKNPEWEYAGVYVDSGISGTGTQKRDEFKRMLDDCEAGKIDVILTKSISRFARNTVDLLETVRHLKDLGIEVRFEKEHINSLSGDGELMLSILASFAQEESRSISENMKWAFRKGFKKGRPNSVLIYGYRWNGEQFIIQPDEAEVVKFIFTSFLGGNSPHMIENELETKGIKSFRGKKMTRGTIRAMLKNEKYTGDLLLQKHYVKSFIEQRVVHNKGELPMYLVENAHEPIISKEMFALVQARLQEIKEEHPYSALNKNRTCFSSKLQCSYCQKNYMHMNSRRKTGEIYSAWYCSTKKKYGIKECPARDVPEQILKEKCCEVLGLKEFDETEFSRQVKKSLYMTINLCLFSRTVKKPKLNGAHAEDYAERKNVKCEQLQRFPQQ